VRICACAGPLTGVLQLFQGGAEEAHIGLVGLLGGVGGEGGGQVGDGRGEVGERGQRAVLDGRAWTRGTGLGARGSVCRSAARQAQTHVSARERRLTGGGMLLSHCGEYRRDSDYRSLSVSLGPVQAKVYLSSEGSWRNAGDVIGDAAACGYLPAPTPHFEVNVRPGVFTLYDFVYTCRASTRITLRLHQVYSCRAW